MVGRSHDESVNAQAVRLQNGLRKLTHAIVHGLEQQLSPHGIDAVEYTILGVCTASGPITVKEVRSKVPIDYTQISRTISRLEDKGLVTKRRLKNDRRIVRVQVTSRGQEIMPELMQGALEFYESLVTDIGEEELVECTAIMERLLATDDLPELDES